MMMMTQYYLLYLKISHQIWHAVTYFINNDSAVINKTKLNIEYSMAITGIILCMPRASERPHYIVTLSLIGWAHALNNPSNNRQNDDLSLTPIRHPIAPSHGEICCALFEYRKVSNIRRTKCQNLNDSRLVLQLPVPNPLKPSIKSIIQM